MYIDLLIKIKNAHAVDKRTLKTRFTQADKAVADILLRRGYVSSVEVKGRPSKRFIFIGLRAERQVEGIRFLSKPSVHVYKGYKEFRLVKGGYGTLVVSTPKGIMTGQGARREQVGGELLFEMW